VHALDTVSAQLAAHYELAGRFEQASLYYERAADMARRVYANAMPSAITVARSLC